MPSETTLCTGTTVTVRQPEAPTFRVSKPEGPNVAVVPIRGLNGTPGPTGSPGPSGPEPELPDLVLLFENGLV